MWLLANAINANLGHIIQTSRLVSSLLRFSPITQSFLIPYFQLIDCHSLQTLVTRLYPNQQAALASTLVHNYY